MQEGSLIEEGTHDKLIAAKGKYSQLWQAETKLAEMV